MKFLLLVDSFVAKFEEYVLAFGILGMFLLLSSNALLRTFVGKSIVFSEEGGQMLLTLITFVGMGYVTRHGKHIRMSAVYDYSGSRVKKILAIIVSFFTGSTLYWFSYIALNYMLSVKRSGRITPALHIPVYLVTGLVVFGLFSSALQYTLIFFLNMKRQGNYLGTYLGAEDKSF